MDAAELKRRLASVMRLTPDRKAELFKTLSARDDEAEVAQLVNSRLAQLPTRAHRAGTRIVRNGVPAACNATSAGVASAPSVR